MPLEPWNNHRMIVIGDRVLIKPESGDERTAAGLILPQSVAEKNQVQSGRVVAVGPGLPMPLNDPDDDEPWRQTDKTLRHIPMQAQVGDLALYLKKASVEIKYANEEYLIVPQSAILILLRDEEEALHFD